MSDALAVAATTSAIAHALDGVPEERSRARLSCGPARPPVHVEGPPPRTSKRPPVHVEEGPGSPEPPGPSAFPW
ncbi:hypothetical protein GPA10_13210 [Streptomyces sp. p1417]|nr:hypothetical protein [Streptomyces typhae]MVO85688.1 hypothetical protein [Streptomyces typhae]